jgi:hypothetical protein
MVVAARLGQPSDRCAKLHQANDDGLRVAGWGPTIGYRERLFAGRILVCEEPIQPGEVGEAIVGVIAVSPEDWDMDVGAHFDLKDGLLNLIAKATVIGVTGKS